MTIRVIKLFMDTRNSYFTINFVTNNGTLVIVPSIDKSFDGIVVARANQTFTINVTSKDIDNSYAAKLFIDCQEVISSKTFKKRGNFFGFRKGGGAYESFVFKMPDFIGSVMPASDQVIKDASKKMGEIRIVFFKAHEVWKKFRVNSSVAKKPLNSDAYKTVPVADTKLCQTRSLSVTVGRQF